MTELERKRFACPLEVRFAGANGEIEGYGSVFGVRDLYGDVIIKGAFRKSIEAYAAALSAPAMLWQHNPDEPIGVWTSLSEDANGLAIKGRIVTETERGKEAYELLKAGAIKGLSIGFYAKAWENTGDDRMITEVDLWEVSLVTFPANPKAAVTSVRSASFDDINTIRDLERHLRDAGLSRETTAAAIAAAKRLTLSERDARQAMDRIQRAASRLLNP